MKTTFNILLYAIFGLLGLSVATSTQAATAWPIDTRTIISEATTLGSGYEPSGIAYHSSRDQFVMVGDDGDITLLTTNGGLVQNWNIGLDLEGVTVADPTSDLIYVVYEEPATLIEFNIATGEVTGNEWDLTTWVVNDNVNTGAEALTFVPNGYHNYAESTSGGLFYVGQQKNAVIYIVDVNLNENGAVTYVDEWAPPTGITSDISGLHFEVSSEKIYALYDGYEMVVEWNLDGTVSVEYDGLPEGDQEGITLRSVCPDSDSAYIYLVDDVDVTVTEYSGFPITCVEEPTPDTPSNLKVKKLAARKVKVSWQGEADEYKLQLRKKNGKLVKRLTVSGTSKKITKQYLKSNKTYKVRVKACTAGNCSSFTEYKKFSL